MRGRPRGALSRGGRHLETPGAILVSQKLLNALVLLVSPREQEDEKDESREHDWQRHHEESWQVTSIISFFEQTTGAHSKTTTTVNLECVQHNLGHSNLGYSE